MSQVAVVRAPAPGQYRQWQAEDKKENGARMGAKASPFDDTHEVALCIRSTWHSGSAMLPGDPVGLSYLRQKTIGMALRAEPVGFTS
jgi:hypothetical protein